MAKKITLQLDEAQRGELIAVRDHHPKLYMRERAAALLKIADGQVVREVARGGQYGPRDPVTVYSWVHRYEAEGTAGLLVRPGRGRKPSSSGEPRKRDDGESGSA